MRRCLPFLAGAALLLASPGPARAQGFVNVGYSLFWWEGAYVGARQSALCGADLAGDETPEAAFLNPAALATGAGPPRPTAAWRTSPARR